jgi:hypothetical protein
MATKKTDTKTAAKTTKTTKAAPKAAKPPKAESNAGPRHPKARVVAKHESKAALAKTLASALVHAGDDAGALETRLTTASNAQLLRLHSVVEKVKAKYGGRDKLIDAIGTAAGKGKDKDYLAKLATLSLPHLLDLALHA